MRRSACKNSGRRYFGNASSMVHGSQAICGLTDFGAMTPQRAAVDRRSSSKPVWVIGLCDALIHALLLRQSAFNPCRSNACYFVPRRPRVQQAVSCEFNVDFAR